MKLAALLVSASLLGAFGGIRGQNREGDLAAKPGSCPPPLPVRICSQSCVLDSHCFRNEKCCATNCGGAICAAPVTMRQPAPNPPPPYRTRKYRELCCPMPRPKSYVRLPLRNDLNLIPPPPSDYRMDPYSYQMNQMNQMVPYRSPRTEVYRYVRMPPFRGAMPEHRFSLYRDGMRDEYYYGPPRYDPYRNPYYDYYYVDDPYRTSRMEEYPLRDPPNFRDFRDPASLRDFSLPETTFRKYTYPVIRPTYNWTSGNLATQKTQQTLKPLTTTKQQNPGGRRNSVENILEPYRENILEPFRNLIDYNIRKSLQSTTTPVTPYGDIQIETIEVKSYDIAEDPVRDKAQRSVKVESKGKLEEAKNMTRVSFEPFAVINIKTIQLDINQTKPGFCPVRPTGKWVCSSTCTVDSDCTGTKKCCRNRCGAYVCEKVNVEIIPSLELPSTAADLSYEIFSTTPRPILYGHNPFLNNIQPINHRSDNLADSLYEDT